MKIGSHTLESNLLLAPMAGVTDRPFRSLCRRFGAGMAVSEMISSDTSLWKSRKTQLRLIHKEETSPRSVQIAGTEPEQLAEAAKLNADMGAEIIDINMGCPAKKVCRKAAGSALLQDEPLVAKILKAVVNAVDIPVTLKFRTGWDPENRNATRIARVAEESGIQALALHGRTRACAYKGEAEYDTIRQVKQTVSIPVIANGDISDAQKAAEVLNFTGADGIMIGRGAHGQPWIFNEIRQFLEKGELPPQLSYEQKSRIVLDHLKAIHNFYEGIQGVRVARKHIGWYLERESVPRQELQTIYKTNESLQQLEQVAAFYELRRQAGAVQHSILRRSANEHTQYNAS